MTKLNLHRFAFALRLMPIAIIGLFFFHPKAVTWMPMYIWMAVFLIGIVIWAVIELRLRYRQGIDRIDLPP